MANSEHLAILKQGVEVWNAWREANPDVEPDFSEVDLSKAYLTHLNLKRANLSQANLSGATFHDSDMVFADLTEANLNGSCLVDVDLMGARLVRAKLNGAILQASCFNADFEEAELCDGTSLTTANLIEANFHKAILRGANLSSAMLSEANFSHADLAGADLRFADLYKANLRHANLRGANLRNAVMVDVKSGGSIFDGCKIYGVSVWGVSGIPAMQRELDIASHGESPILVDDLETAQFVHLLLHHEKLRNVINAVTQKGVLLLGRFSDGGLDTLQAIADKLRALSYLPIIFDFDRPDDRDYTETIMTLAGLSRFVIADLSGRSVPHELSHVLPVLEIPFTFIYERGGSPYSMLRDFRKYPWALLPPIEYADTDGLVALLEDQVIAPAEAKHHELQLQKARDLLAGDEV